ncbi:MAG TPA: DUF3857 domain-containing protein [bacterium]|nr:DUF3857 domain-containing protein [bacterium]
MKRILVSLVVLALATTAGLADQWLDTNVTELTENAPTKEDRPDDSAVFLKMQEMAEIAEDGSVVTTRNKLIKILTLRGRERHSNQSFLYNTEESVLTLVKGVTVRGTGRVVEVEEDAVNDVTPAFLEGASMYANVMDKVFSFPIVGPGSTIELQLRGEHQPASDGSYSGIEYMGSMDPILDASFTVRYPGGADAPKSIGYTGSLGTTTIRKSNEPGEIIYSVYDVPALVEEEHMPPASELYPTVVYSSYTDWQQPAAFFAGEFFPHVETDGSIAARVAELTQGLTSYEDKLRVIFLDVTTGVRNVYLNLGLGGYAPNDASQVLENKYADTRDKAVLLISMLRAAGIDAYPALVAGLPGARFTEPVPTLKQFSRILVAMPDDDSYRYLDPFLDDVYYGFLRWGRGNTALIVRDDGAGELVEIPGFRTYENHSRRVMDVSIDSNGDAAVRVSCDLAGYFDRKTRRDLKDATAPEAQKLFDTAANLVSMGATDSGYSHSDLSDLAEPVRVTQEIDAEGFAVPQGDMMIVHLPPFPFSFASIGVSPSLSERRYPFEFPCEFTSDLEINLQLPEGYSVVQIPEDTAFTTPAAALELTCEFHEDQHVVVWRQSVTVNERSIAVDDYAGFKENYDSLASPKNQLLLLKKS